jgi:hypothetical protein
LREGIKQHASNPSSDLQLIITQAFLSDKTDNGAKEFVADYSGATVPESHGFPIIGTFELQNIT